MNTSTQGIVPDHPKSSPFTHILRSNTFSRSPHLQAPSRPYRESTQTVVSVTEEAVKVEVALPGFSPEEVEVTVKDRILHIDAKKDPQEEFEDNDEMGLRGNAPFWENAYRYSSELPKGAILEDTEARFVNGLLTVQTPLIVDNPPKIVHKVEVKTSEK